MFNFHKPRVYRSADGCCICRAKSSSSRFTASRKYEKESMLCFNLQEPRNGEICNACVLLVKRYKRLPVGSKRHWGHVVDARAGPGTKSLAKQKKRESECEAKAAGGGTGNGNGSGSFIPEKFAKIFKKNRKGKITAVAAPSTAVIQQEQQQQRNGSSHESSPQLSDSNESYDDEQHQLQQRQQQQHQQQQQQQQQSAVCSVITPYQTRKRTAAAAQLASAGKKSSSNSVGQRTKVTGSKRRRMLEPQKHRRAVDNVPFFEEQDLLRLEVCCGIVFQSLSLGSACYIIDPELYKPCEKHRRRSKPYHQQQQEHLQQQQKQQEQQQQMAQVQSEIETKPKLTQSISTPALKKHHLYFKRQSESFPQGEIHRISPIPLNKTEIMPNSMPIAAAITVQQQQHSTANSSLSVVLKPATATSAAAAVTSSSVLHPSILTTAVGAASPSSLSSSSNCSTSSSVATKFNDNSSDSGFDEHVLERKSVSPPSQDEMHMDKKHRGAPGGVQRLILASGLPISGQSQNLVLTGNEFTARFVQRTQPSSLKINVAATTVVAPAVAVAAAAGVTTTGSQSSSGNKMRAIFNNANTIQHENGVTTILPASSLAASNQTAAMNAIAPSTVTITPAKKSVAGATVVAAAAAATATATLVANPKFIVLKPAIAKFGSNSNTNNINNNNNNNQAPAEVK